MRLLLCTILVAVAMANKSGPDPNGHTIINGRVFKGNPGYHAAMKGLAEGFFTWPVNFAIPINSTTQCPDFDTQKLGWNNVNEYIYLIKTFGEPTKNWPVKLVRCLHHHCTAGQTDLVCHLLAREHTMHPTMPKNVDEWIKQSTAVEAQTPK